MIKSIRETLCQRMVPGAPEVRQEPDETPRISGYGAVFYRSDDPGTEFTLMPGVRERILPGAFDGIEREDVRSTFNHDMSALLGRTKSGTLRLSVDEYGLRYEVDINPDDVQAMSTLAKIRRGDVDGSSFWFYIEDEERVEDDETGDSVYEIRKVRVVEVGPVSVPAYQATTAEQRSAHIEARRQQLAAIEAQRAKAIERDRLIADMDLKLRGLI